MRFGLTQGHAGEGNASMYYCPVLMLRISVGYMDGAWQNRSSGRWVGGVVGWVHFGLARLVQAEWKPLFSVLCCTAVLFSFSVLMLCMSIASVSYRPHA